MGMDFGDLGRGRPWSCGCRRTISPGIETARDLAVARPTKGGRPRPPQGKPSQETSTHPDYRAADGSVRISVAARSKSRVCT